MKTLTALQLAIVSAAANHVANVLVDPAITFEMRWHATNIKIAAAHIEGNFRKEAAYEDLWASSTNKCWMDDPDFKKAGHNCFVTAVLQRVKDGLAKVA